MNHFIYMTDERNQNNFSVEEKLANNIPLRAELPSDLDLKSKATAYKMLLQQAEQHRPLPETAQHLSYSIDWPINPMDDEVLIACPFQSFNYLDPNVPDHHAVDIQGPVGKDVIAPTDIRIFEFSIDPRSLNRNEEIASETLADITFVVEAEMEDWILVGNISHMRLADMPDQLRSREAFFDTNSSLRIRRGEKIGAIGDFPHELRSRQRIPEQVKQRFGESYNHIHIKYILFPRNTFHQLSKWDFHAARLFEQTGAQVIDPILLSRF